MLKLGDSQVTGEGDGAERLRGSNRLPMGTQRGNMTKHRMCDGEEAQQIKVPGGKNKLTGIQGLGDLMDPKDEAGTRAVDGALMYYAAAWTRGFALDAVAARRGYIDQRRGKLANSRLASAGWLGSLKPAVETLASYGAGGFDPQIIAQLIQALSVTGIAVGVNK